MLDKLKKIVVTLQRNSRDITYLSHKVFPLQVVKIAQDYF